MASRQSEQAKISALKKQLAALQKKGKPRVIAEMREQIENYGIQPAELFPGAAAKPAVAVKAAAVKAAPGRRAAPGKKPLPPKFQDPATGRTWNGHGKRPLWMPKDRSKDSAFLIAGAADAPKKRGPKPKSPAAKAALAKAVKKLKAGKAKAAPAKRGPKPKAAKVEAPAAAPAPAPAEA
ncbi:MAG: H-NS histone family protein [Candidatus Accumulibacter sp.]|jgi:DNA-binding protein H-NS|nr:H-NS histone family protein [Accumulibacter sp.]